MKSNVIKKSCLLFTSVACLMFSSPAVLGFLPSAPPKGIGSIDDACQQHWQTNLKKNFKGYKLYECDNNESFIKLSKNGKLGLIDKNGNMILPTEYTDVRYQSAMYSDEIESKQKEGKSYILAKRNKNGKYAVFNLKGKLISSFEYDSYIHQFDDYLMVKKDIGFGLIDYSGNVLIPFEYDYIDKIYKKYIFKVNKGNQYGLFNINKGKLFVPVQWNNITDMYGDYVSISRIYYDHNKKREFEKVGVMNINTGKIIAPIEYDKISLTEDFLRNGNQFYILKKNEKVGGFHWKTGSLIPANFVDIRGDTASNLVFVKQEESGKWAVFDGNTGKLTSFEYDDIDDRFLDSSDPNIAYVKKGEDWGIVHRNRWVNLDKLRRDGNSIIDIRSQGNIFVSFRQRDRNNSQNPELWKLFNTQENKYVLSDKGYEILEVFGDKYILSSISGESDFFVFSDGKITPAYIDDFDLVESKGDKSDRMIIKEGGKSNLFNFNLRKKEENKLLGSYDDISEFKNELAVVKSGDRYGVINWDGELIIPLEYDDIFIQSSDFFAVSENKKWGWINNKNQVIVPIKYKDIPSFDNGYFMFRESENSGLGLVDRDGKVIVPFEYDYLVITGGFIAVTKNNKWGWLDMSGNLILPLEYDSVSKFRDGYATVEKDGKKWRMDSSGKLQPLDE